MPKRNLSFPLEQISSMGGEYIHSNWLYFGNTIDSYSSEIKKTTDVIRDIIIKYLEEEVDFYRESQDAYIKMVSKNSKSKFTTEDEILQNFRDVYKAQMNNEKTDFGQLNIIKNKVSSLGDYYWTKKSKNQIFISGSERGKSLEEAQKAVGVALEGIEKYIDFVNNNKNLGFLSKSRYSGGEDNLASSLEQISDKKSKDSIYKKIKKLRTILENQETKKLKTSHINIVHGIMNDLHVHGWSGILAESFQKELIQNEFPELLVQIGNKNKDFGDVAKKFMNVNIIDVAVGEVETKRGNTLIGLSQKFTNRELIEGKSYKNQDIFHSLQNYANSRMKKAGSEQRKALEKAEPYFKYIRKNIIALESFALDSKNSSIFNKEEFYKVEEELALLRNFLRFFNGMTEMLEDGTFNVFNPSAKEELQDTRIYTAFLAFRQEIYWTISFIEPILESIKTSESLSGPGFYTWAKRRDLPNVKKSAAEMWNKKRKRLKELKKLEENVTYEDLQTNVASYISRVSKDSGDLLIDSLVYTLNPQAFFTGRKK